MPHGHRGRGRPKNRSGDGVVDSRIQVEALEGWRKMEAAAANRAGCGE